MNPDNVMHWAVATLVVVICTSLIVVAVGATIRTMREGKHK